MCNKTENIKNNRLVSVIIPTYNRADLIIETLDSVYGQSYRPIELLIIDDGSTDNTKDVVFGWSKSHAEDSSFTIEYFEKDNRGASSARNFGINKSHGEYIQFLDSDDLLSSDKIRNQVEYSKLTGMTVFGDCQRFSADSKGVLLYSFVARNRPETALKDWFEGRFIIPVAFLWKREDIIKNGQWDESLSFDDDGEFSRRFLMGGGRWAFSPGAISYYRIYTDTRPRLSNTNTVSGLQAQFKILRETERKLIELGWFSKLKKSFAICYWNLAKHAVFEPEIKKVAMSNYKRLIPSGYIPENGIDCVLYKLLGILGRKKFVNFVRALFKAQPFKPIGRARNIKEILFSKRKYRFAIIAPAVFYYHVPVYQKLASSEDLDSVVFYCTTWKSLGQNTNAWGEELGGYKFNFLKNYSPSPSIVTPFGLVNFSLWKEITSNKYDAVVLQMWNNFTYWLAFVACLVSKTRIIFMTDANVLSEYSKSKWRAKIKKLLLKHILFKRSAGFLAQGDVNRKFYEYYGVPADKIACVPYTWGYDWFLSMSKQIKPKRKELRAGFGIEEEDFVLLFVGRLSEEKMVITLLKAFNQVDNSSKKLFIVGEGALRDKIERTIGELNVKNVYLTGFKQREDLCNLYAIADALVLPSAHEPWGMVVNEAMCFGLPIIASDKVGAAVDLVRNGYNGFISEAGNVQDLADSVLRLISLSKEERVRFGDRSSELILEWINKMDPASNMLKAFQSLLK